MLLQMALFHTYFYDLVIFYITAHTHTHAHMDKDVKYTSLCVYFTSLSIHLLMDT